MLTALNGTLIGKWFDKYDTPAAVAANFAVSIVLLIPVCLIVSYSRAELAPLAHALLPVGLLLFGTLLSAALGRALYQVALHVTDNDNGFVTLFFLLVPALSCLIAIPLSYWVSEVHVQINIPFFAGLMVVAIPLLFFCIKSWRADAGASPGARDSTDQGQQEKMAPAE